MRQAKSLAHRSGRSLEEARQAVSDSEAGRQLRDLANGEHRYEKASQWQVSVFWDRVEERWMHLVGSEALSRIAAERHHYYGEPNVSAPRVLIAIQPRMYAEVLAFSIGQHRPHADVSLLSPSEELEDAVQRLRPHLVVANRVPEAAREDAPFFWVEMDEARGGEGTKRLGARISADGYSESVQDVQTEHVLAALDQAEVEFVSKGADRARGAGSSS